MEISVVFKKAYILIFFIFSFVLYSYPVNAAKKISAPHVKLEWFHNSCWYHAGLQCFFATKELTEKLLKLDPKTLKLNESLSDIEKKEEELKAELKGKRLAYATKKDSINKELKNQIEVAIKEFDIEKKLEQIEKKLKAEFKDFKKNAEELRNVAVGIGKKEKSEYQVSRFDLIPSLQTILKKYKIVEWDLFLENIGGLLDLAFSDLMNSHEGSEYDLILEKINKLPDQKSNLQNEENLLRSYVDLLKTAHDEGSNEVLLKDKDCVFRANLKKAFATMEEENGFGSAEDFCENFLLLLQKSPAFNNKREGAHFILDIRDIMFTARAKKKKSSKLKSEKNIKILEEILKEAPKFLIITYLHGNSGEPHKTGWLDSPWGKKEFFCFGEKYSVYAMAGGVPGTGGHFWAYAQDGYTNDWWYYNDLLGIAQQRQKNEKGEYVLIESVIDGIFKTGRDTVNYGGQFGSPYVLFYRREDNLADKVSELADSFGDLKTGLTDLSGTLASVQKRLAVK